MQNLKYIIFCFFILTAVESIAQLRLNNIAEYQLGNLPNTKPKNLSSLYNQLDVTYKQKQISVFGRIEQFHPSFNKDAAYTQLSQYRAQYRSAKFSFEAGNIYSSLGKGLLLRTYEIPASVYEDRGFRVRYGFYKDLQGISAKYRSKYLDAKILRGRVLSVELPPTFSPSDRRIDLVEGGELNLKHKKQSLGLALLRQSTDFNSSFYHSFSYNGSYKKYSFYAEIAQRTDSTDSYFVFNPEEAYAAYFGMNYSGTTLGYSIELKDYNKFLIGSGVNDPPTLVKEHSFKLLNRSTHIPLIENEKGYQTEVYYINGKGSNITFNHSLAYNSLGGRDFVFAEFYLEFSKYIKDLPLKIFIDYSTDELLSEKIRLSGGGNFEFGPDNFYSTLNFESQFIERQVIERTEIINLLFSYGFSINGKYSASFLVETSNDPDLQSDKNNTLFYPSVNLGMDIDKHNKISLFAGKRRGGPACSSGVCYDVLDFEGIEIRLNTRF